MQLWIKFTRGVMVESRSQQLTCHLCLADPIDHDTRTGQSFNFPHGHTDSTLMRLQNTAVTQYHTQYGNTFGCRQRQIVTRPVNILTARHPGEIDALREKSGQGIIECLRIHGAFQP